MSTSFSGSFNRPENAPKNQSTFTIHQIVTIADAPPTILLTFEDEVKSLESLRYSVASSRTGSTDYGLVYRRILALSQETFEANGWKLEDNKSFYATSSMSEMAIGMIEGTIEGENSAALRHEEPPVVVLRLQVLGCQDLLSKDRVGTIDPFVVVSFLTMREQTPVSSRTVNPVYLAKDATFDFPIYLSLANKLGPVELVVWDDHVLGKNYLGEVSILLKDWFGDKEEYEFEFDLPGNKPSSLNLSSSLPDTLPSGSIQVKLGFAPTSHSHNLTEFDGIDRELVKRSRPSENGENTGLRHRRYLFDDELVYDDSDGVTDDLHNATPIPHDSISCVLHPSDRNCAYFFCGNRYALINIDPGTTGDTITSGPKSILEDWSSLSNAGFAKGVDAVLPNPMNNKEMYFFCGDEYALIKNQLGTTKDYIVNGPKKIATEWPSLRQARFNIVNAVLPNPANKKEAYFFSGDQFALINIKPGSNNDYIVNGPKPIWSNWSSLQKAGFRTVDAILPNPNNSYEAYFFSVDRYVLINVTSGLKSDYIVTGPRLIRAEWPSLQKCGFW